MTLMEKQKRGLRPRKKTKKSKSSKSQEFKCDNCGSEHFLKGNDKVKKHRQIFNHETKKMMKLCNACGLRLKREASKKPKAADVKRSDIGKDKYLEEGRSFGMYVAGLVNDEMAKQFFCPKFRSKPCQCLQTFMQSNLNDIEEIKKRASLLLRYHRKATELIEAGPPENSCRRSKEFESFVLTNRDYLKSQLCLCEPAVQKVLRYSNNFLYKPREEDGRRISVKQTIGAEKLQIPVEKIGLKHNQECTSGECENKVKSMAAETP